MVTLNNSGEGVAEALLADIRKSIDEIKATPNSELEEAVSVYEAVTAYTISIRFQAVSQA